MIKKLTGLILAYGFGYAIGFIGIITVFGVIGFNMTFANNQKDAKIKEYDPEEVKKKESHKVELDHTTSFGNLATRLLIKDASEWCPHFARW